MTVGVKKIIAYWHSIVLCFILMQASSQTKIIDSLKQIINNNPANEIEVIFSLCDNYRSMSADTLYHYISIAQKISDTKNNQLYKLKTNYYLAIYYHRKGYSDSAVNICELSEKRIGKSFQQNSDIKKIYFNFLLLKPNILVRSQKYKEAISFMYDVLPIVEQWGTVENLMNIENNMGYAYMEMMEHTSAISWFNRVVQTANKNNLSELKNMGITYSNLAAEYDNINNADSAFYFIQKSIRLAKKYEDNGALANALFIEAEINKNQKKNYRKAEGNMLEAIEIRKQIGDPYYIVSDMAELSDFYATVNRPKKGIVIAKQAIDVAKKNNLSSKLILIYTALANNYKIAKEYKKYGETEELIIRLNDSINSLNPANAIAEMQVKYETQQKQNTIIQQKLDLTRQNYLLYGMTGLLVVIITIGLAIYKNRQKNQQIKWQQLQIENERKTNEAINKAKEEERQYILADLHDDIGADISSIYLVSNLINQHADNKELTIDFSKRISNITKELSQRMNVIFWALRDENNTLENLSYYIIQYGNKLFEKSHINFRSEYSNIDFDKIILNGLQRKNIFLCVKETLNNVIKHAHAKETEVKIIINAEKKLQIIVKDDGIGLVKDNPNGNGFKNIKRRMNEIGGMAYFETDHGAIIKLILIV